MKIKITVVLVFTIVLNTNLLNATIIETSSCERVAVQAAIDGANTVDTIKILPLSVICNYAFNKL